MTGRVLTVVAIVWLTAGVAFFPKWTVDDAYITYRYAENLARHGEFVFNAGEPPVEGYTGVLLPLLVAGAVWLRLDADSASKAIGILALAMTALGLWRALALTRVRSWLRGLTLVVFSAAPILLTHALGGLETMLYAAFVTWALCGILDCVEHPGDRRRQSALLLTLLFACLARPEGVALAATAVVALAAFHARRDRTELAGWMVLSFIVLAVPVATYFCWRWWYYGQLMPNTYYAKWHWRTNVESLRLAASFAARYVALPAAAAVVLGLAQPREFARRLRALQPGVWWAFLVTCAFAAVVLAQYSRSALIMNYSHRFFVPFLAVSLLFAAAAAEAAVTAFASPPENGPVVWRKRLGTGVAAALVALQLAVDARALRTEVVFARATEQLLADEHQRVAELLRERLPPSEWVIVVVDSGAIPYFSGAKTVDFGGLNDAFIGRRFYNAHPESAIVDYFYSRHAGAVVVTSTRPDRISGPEPTNVFDDPRFADYVRVATFGSASYPDYYQFVYARTDLAGRFSQSPSEQR